jgi:hypothetical protein
MKKLQQTQHNYAFTLILFPRFSIKMITFFKNQTQTSCLTVNKRHQNRAAKSPLLFNIALIHLTTLTFENIIRSIEFAALNDQFNEIYGAFNV